MQIGTVLDSILSRDNWVLLRTLYAVCESGLHTKSVLVIFQFSTAILDLEKTLDEKSACCSVEHIRSGPRTPFTNDVS